MVKISTNNSNIVKYTQIKSRHKQYIYINSLYLWAMHNIKMKLNIDNFKWTRQPESYVIKGDTIEVVTKPETDLWQRTYYHFRNDNAPVFQMETEE